MKVLFWGLFIFCIAFLTHIVVWRIRTPRGQTKCLLKIFFTVLLISLFYLRLASLGGFLAHLHIALLVVSLALFYITTYSAIEADSPSLVMAMSIAQEGLKGLSKEQLFKTLSDDILIKPRIIDLVNAGLIYLDSDRYKITKKGVYFIRIFILYRRLIKLPKGG